MINSGFLTNSKKILRRGILFLLRNNIIAFVLGFLLSIYLTGALWWDSDWHFWLGIAPRENSVFVMTFVYVSTYLSLRSFSHYLGKLSFRFVIPLFVFWFFVGVTCILILRAKYSIYYLAISATVMLLFLLVSTYVSTVGKKQIIAYVPVGRIDELPDIHNIIWEKLESPQKIDSNKYDMVMADLRADLSDEWEHFLADCTLQQIPVYHSNRLLELISGRVKIDHMYENELGSLLPSKNYQLIKRWLDIVLVLFSLPFVLPIMMIFALLIMLESRGNIIFSQERVGQGGKTFTMYKFRSMYTGTAIDITTHSADTRVTKIGKFMRKTRIDELPQFFNVLKGDMSLIGPRAEFHKFVQEYEKEIPFYHYRHIIKPGISGWAQVMQGYNFGVDKTRIKQEYDFYYIKNFSFSMDLLILFKTIKTVLTGFGAR